MENTNQSQSSQGPGEAEPSVDARLRALERQLAEQSERREAMGTDEPPLRRAELSAELDHHRDQLRDYEKALVERIADVDDDRRTTASRLQRAWQTQREEIDERLRRHVGLLGGLLLLFAILFAAALFLVYRQGATAPPQNGAEISEVRQELERLSGERAVDEQVRNRLDQVSAQVRELASVLEGAVADRAEAERDSIAGERATRIQAEERIAAEIRRLDGEQGRLARDFGSIRSTLKTLEAELEAARADAAAVTRADVPATEEAAAPVPAADGVGTRKEDRSDRPAPELDAAANRHDVDADLPESDAADVGGSGSGESLVVPETRYALQLIGFFNRSSFVDFAGRSGLPARIYSIRQTYKDRPWYVMIHSLHEDYDAAARELSRLPADLVALDPWIRPLSAGTELQVIETGPER